MKIHTLALLALAAAAPAAAQSNDAGLPRSTTRGFVLGVHLNGSALTVGDDNDPESGGGLGLTFGYGVSNHFTLFARGDAADVSYADGGGSYTLAHADLGARYSFASAARALRPFVEASFQGAGVTDDVDGSDVSIRGGAFGIAGGVEYFFNPKLALDVGLGFSGGKFTKGTVDGEEVDLDDYGLEQDFTSSRFNIGVSWRP